MRDGAMRADTMGAIPRSVSRETRGGDHVARPSSPRASWWTTASRDGFWQMAWREWARMRHSKEAAEVSGIQGIVIPRHVTSAKKRRLWES